MGCGGAVHAGVRVVIGLHVVTRLMVGMQVDAGVVAARGCVHSGE